jgi:5'-3' exonuclease
MKTVIIDSHYLAYKAWFTTGLLSYKEKPVGVIFGFINQIFTIGQFLKPDEMVFCWDSKKSIRRHHYPFYKNRPHAESEMPIEDAFTQFDELREEILPTLGFCNNFRQAGYEADDLIAQIVKSKQKTKYIVVSSDDDLLQLLDDCIIYNLGKGRIVTKDDLLTEYGVTPSQWVEVKKIAGCRSDTIPGVPGVAEITAANYLTGKLKADGKKYQTIKQYATEELLKRNDWLIRLPLPGTKLPEIKQSNFKKSELIKLCQRLGFTHLLNDPGKLEDWAWYFGERKEPSE